MPTGTRPTAEAILLSTGLLSTVELMSRCCYGADLNARDNYGRLPIDLAHNEEIKQAIRDEPRRRMDEAPGKRATEQDRHPNTSATASAQEDEEEAKEEQSNKRPRLNDEGAVVAEEEEETKVAEEDEDSEPSSDEDDD